MKKGRKKKGKKALPAATATTTDALRERERGGDGEREDYKGVDPATNRWESEKVTVGWRRRWQPFLWQPIFGHLMSATRSPHKVLGALLADDE